MDLWLNSNTTGIQVYWRGNSNENFANNLAYIYLRKGQLREAKQILENRSWRKGYFFVVATKGLLNILEGNINQGVRLYDEAENLAWNTELKRLVRQKKYLELGRYYLVSGDIQNAKTELHKALSVKTLATVYSLEVEKLLSIIS